MDLLPALRTHLVDAEIVRAPADAGSLPPLWLEPKLGLPAPGEPPPEGTGAGQIGKDAVLGAWTLPGIAPARHNAGRRTDFVQLRLRTRTAPIAHALEESIRAVLIDKRNWTMGELVIIEALLYRDMAPLGSDKQGFDWSLEYSFERYSGLP